MKNKLGKLTFGMLCSFLVLYIFYNIYSMFTFLKIMYELSILSDIFNLENFLSEILGGFGGFRGICSLSFSFLIGPVICWLVALIYTIVIGLNKRVNITVYIITAVAILFNLFGAVLSNGLLPILKIVFILILFAAFLTFILLCIFYKKNNMKKTMNIAIISVYCCAIVFEIINFLIEIASILINISYLNFNNVFSNLLWYGIIFISLIVGGLVLGYILFPEKYLKTEEQNEL